MKNRILNFLALTAGLVALVSCEREMEFTSAGESGTIHVTVHASAREEAPVKTYLDTYMGTDRTVLWGVGEQMMLAVTSAGSTAFASSEKTDAFDGEPEATFSFTVSPATSESYLYQGIYPASAAVPADNTNPSSYKVNLPSVQNATAGSYDPAAFIMIAQPHTFYGKETSWTAAFRRASALDCITLKGIPAGKSVKRVIISAPDGTSLCGVREMNLSTGASGAVTGGGNTIDVKYATPLAGGSDIAVWFTSWAAEIGVGETLTIAAYTTDSYVYEKEIVIPAGHPISFLEGYLNTVNVSMSGITPVLYAFSGGKGTIDNPWRIETVADLEELATKVNADSGTYSTDYYRQSADIDFEGNDMQAIGNTNDENEPRYFKGSYHGAGFKVMNVNIVNSEAGKAAGFFGYLAEAAHVDGLVLENPKVSVAANNLGAVVGCIQPGGTVLVENCVVTGGSVHTKGNYSCAGGIAGKQMNGSTIRNCSYSGIVWAENQKAGGIVGEQNNNGSAINCSVTGALTKVVANNANAGGIVGYLSGGTHVIEDCVVDCEAVIGSKGYVGGVVGDWAGGAGRINGCTVHCDVTNNSSSGSYGNLGGVVGYIAASDQTVVIANCVYAGGNICNFSGTSGCVAGIVGGANSNALDQKYIVNSCAFPDKLLSGYPSAGSSRNIAGIGGWMKYVTIRNCYSPLPRTSIIYDGDVIGADRETGSIYGWFSSYGRALDVYYLDTFKVGKGTTTSQSAQSVTDAQMHGSGSVTRPSTGVAYANFVDALNADAAAWNDSPVAGVTARSWEMGASGYPVPAGTATPSAPVPVSGPNLLNLLNQKIAEYNYSSSAITNHVFVVAHRANTYWSVTNQWPENSLPAIEHAIEAGADMIELDVRLTSDGIPVLMHNEGLRYTTDGSGLVTEKTLEYVKGRKMKARGTSTYKTWKGDYVRVPTLAEALAFIKGKNVYVDLDIQHSGEETDDVYYPAVNTIIDVIYATGTRDQVMIYGGGSKDNKREYIRQGNDLLGGPLAINPFISTPADIQNWVSGFWGCAKLFQYSYEIYYNGTIPNFGGECHARGALSFSNCLNINGGTQYDEELVAWYTGGDLDDACDVLDRFTNSNSDFLQTDYAEIAISYLTRNGYR